VVAVRREFFVGAIPRFFGVQFERLDEVRKLGLPLPGGDQADVCRLRDVLVFERLVEFLDKSLKGIPISEHPEVEVVLPPIPRPVRRGAVCSVGPSEER
jgi:hypothetical protein